MHNYRDVSKFSEFDASLFFNRVQGSKFKVQSSRFKVQDSHIYSYICIQLNLTDFYEENICTCS